MKQNKLTISQLAAYAKVTVRAIRYYHKISLLPEPSRDASGYRRYDAQALISLIRIKTLTDAGIPLAQIHTVLQATGADFDKTIGDIEASISKRITDLKRTKKLLRQLQSGDALYLQPVVAQYLNHLRQLGISEELIEMERDGWVLLSALLPDKIKMLVNRKTALLQDVQFVRLYQQYDQARHWDVSDPRLETLAEQTIAVTETHSKKLLGDSQGSLSDSAHAQSLISTYEESMFPSWKRLEEIIEKKQNFSTSGASTTALNEVLKTLE